MDTLIILLTFFLAGSVKGVIGMGLPTVSLAILAVAFDLTTAMALLVVPSLLTNLWQAFDGQHLLNLIKRLWPFLLSATLCVVVGSIALKYVELQHLSTLLGILLALYAVLNLAGLHVSVPVRRESAVGMGMGCINGILTGMTGSSVFPGVMYLQALDLPREALIQAMGILFSLAAIALGVALYNHQLFDKHLAVQSALGFPPALIGMIVGKQVRKKLNDSVFRKVFFVSILVMGVFLIWRSLAG